MEMITYIFELQLYISIAYNDPGSPGGRRVGCQIVNIFSTRGACNFELFVRFDKKHYDLLLPWSLLLHSHAMHSQTKDPSILLT